MLKFYLKLDAYLLNMVQEAYLWILDRTGIYAASVAFICYLPTPVSGFSTSPYFNGFMILTVALSLSQSYLLQDHGKHEVYNVVAGKLEKLPIRIIFGAFMNFSIIPSFFMKDLLFTATSILMCIYMYMLCVKIRERNKKKFFEFVPKPTPKLVPEMG